MLLPDQASRSLLLTDVVDSTQLAERLGDARAAVLWAEHDRLARLLLVQHGGHEIDRTDGVFILFDAAADAVRYALAYHAALDPLGMLARVGIHSGPVTLRHNAPEDVARGAKPLEVEGLAKPFAARVMALAGGGQTLLSAAVRDAIAGALDHQGRIESHGHYRLKGLAEPVELFEFGAPGVAPLSPPADADKAWRVVRLGDLWRPLREVPHNLPAERDAFVGRRAELAAMAARFDAGTRLLTVLGPGGTGKTRFARRYGWTWLGDWPGGVYFCDLSEARSLDGCCFAVAVALDVPLGKDDPAQRLGHAIAGRGRCLIILDNFEQVLQHAAATLGGWLDRAGQACFLVTSRERLQLRGEVAFPIEPLGLDQDAIDLFVARARAQRPDFALTDGNRDAVARIVALLDGLPLAIELAAARVRLLSPAQIVQRMRHRFSLLAGARGAAARQATLRAAIDWSWDLLAPWEQASLAQCSVFEGGFTIEAAESVLDLRAWPDAPLAMDAVQALVDKSLLRVWVPAQQRRFDIDEPHFGMYLSIQAYAAEKLDADGGGGGDGGPRLAAERAHGSYYAGFGSDQAIEACFRHGGVKRLFELALELDNLVAASRRAIYRRDGPTALAACAAAWEVLDLRGPVGLGVTLGAQVLALGLADPAQQLKAQVTLARATERSGNTPQAQLLLDGALGLARQMGDRRAEGLVLGRLGGLQREQGALAEAQRLLQAALAVHREVGNRPAEATVLHNLGNVFDQTGQAALSRMHHLAALAIHRDLGNRRFEGNVLAGLAILDRHQGRMDDALAHYEAALAIHREVGDRRSEGIALGNQGNVWLDKGLLEPARACYEAALAIHREVGSRIVEAYALANLGGLQFQHRRLAEAVQYNEAALLISREVQDHYHEAAVLGWLGELDQELGHFERARQRYDEALRCNRAVGNRREEGVVLGRLADLLRHEQRLDDAAELLRLGEALLRDVDNPLELGGLLCIKGRVQAAAGQDSAARATLGQAQAIGLALGAGPGSALGLQIGRLLDLLGD